jgi:hypothetical protein
MWQIDLGGCPDRRILEVHTAMMPPNLIKQGRGPKFATARAERYLVRAADPVVFRYTVTQRRIYPENALL